MTIMVTVGFGALNEDQNVQVAEILRRLVAAVQRVDSAGWLQDFLAGPVNNSQRKLSTSNLAEVPGFVYSCTEFKG